MLIAPMNLNMSIDWGLLGADSSGRHTRWGAFCYWVPFHTIAVVLFGFEWCHTGHSGRPPSRAGFLLSGPAGAHCSIGYLELVERASLVAWHAAVFRKPYDGSCHCDGPMISD